MNPKPVAATKSISTPAQPERAEPGTCQYIVREEGRQKECGCPAFYQGRSRPFLKYCRTHGEFVSRSFEVIALEAGPDGVRKVLKPLKLQQRY